MYPKSIRFYLVSPEFFETNTIDTINDALSERPFQAPEPMQLESFGWVPAFHDSELMCESVSGKWFICGQTREKIIPPSAINEIVAERVEEIEQTQGRTPVRKERMEIKDSVIHENLPTALTKTSRVAAWIDPVRGIMAVCASSERKADTFTSLLRESLGSLPVSPAYGYVHHDLTAWWLCPEDRPNNLSFECDFSLHLPADHTVKSTFKNHDIESEEMKICIDGGMVISKARVDYEELASFTIDQSMTMSRIKYSDALIEKASESEDSRADAILMLDVISSWADSLGFHNRELDHE